ncbi:MAG TPA: arylsulfatase [Tepidisphaeraceae bacterium]|nr:arylsulfatase [Tepidisphaeraceae bacterium]
MNARDCLGLLLALFSICCLPSQLRAADAKPAPRPNIVLIMADDMGYSDLGCYGSEIHTPNIDHLASQGVRWTQFYNCGRCCPTRASLLTGLYSHQAGVGQMIEDRGSPAYRGELNDQCVTLAEALRLAGYRCDMVGKWHVVHIRITGKEQVNHHNNDPFWFNKDNWPANRGFQSYYGTIIGVDDYFDPFTLTEGLTPIESAPPKGFYYTDAIADHAVGRIESDATANQPFFLYVAFTAPHWPLQAPPEDIEKYKDAYKEGWDKLHLTRHAKEVELGIVDPKWQLPPREPEARAWDAAPDHEWHARRMAVYAAQIDRLDQGVGRILKAIDDANIAENTLVIFLSDNGGCQEEVQPSWFDVCSATRDGRPVRVGDGPRQRDGAMPGPETVYQSYGPSWASASNTPFRRYKHFAHEGGISTPFIARWPAAIHERGTIRNETGHIIDLMPTFLALAGGAYPKTFHGHPITPEQGISLVRALTGEAHEPHPPLFWEHEGNRAVRVGDWKLVAQNKKRWELYDIVADRTETHDRSKQMPQKVQELEQEYQAWADRVGVKPWPQPEVRQKPRVSSVNEPAPISD